MVWRRGVARREAVRPIPTRAAISRAMPPKSACTINITSTLLYTKLCLVGKQSKSQQLRIFLQQYVQCEYSESNSRGSRNYRYCTIISRVIGVYLLVVLVVFLPTKNSVVAVLTGRKLTPPHCFTNSSPRDQSRYSARRLPGTDAHDSPARAAAEVGSWQDGIYQSEVICGVDGMHELRVALVVRTPA